MLVDTPGLHRPRTLLGQRLNDLVREVRELSPSATVIVTDRTGVPAGQL
ncbi:GTPase Era [Mycobacteroides abscessus subsp. abscessus]|nr:GTPase Era [Mycobacteroides abscessus subsp. abscessus]